MLSPEQKEFKLQLAVVRHLDLHYKGKCEWFHCPNRPGNATDGHFKKMMGAKAGTPDLVISWRGKIRLPECAFIELKAPGGTISSVQNKFLSRWAFLGWNTAICKSVHEVNETLREWGLDSGMDKVVEPDYRTWDDKVEDVLNHYAPPTD